MGKTLTVRDFRAEDRAAAIAALAEGRVFSGREQALAADMIEAGLKGRYELRVVARRGVFAGYACFGPSAGAERVWDLYWICVTARERRRGCGRRLMGAVEAAVRAAGGTTLVAETSSRRDYAPARRFYDASGFQETGRVADFHGPGDANIVYTKRLSQPLDERPRTGPLPPIDNLTGNTFACTFGRGCEGTCCREEPILEEEDVWRVGLVLPAILERLRPAARAAIEASGFVSLEAQGPIPKLRVLDGWCVLFHRGCELHRIGAEEGDKFKYKPLYCAAFPLDLDRSGRWYLRQHRYRGESWDLPCLDPNNAREPAERSLRDEIALVRRIASDMP